MGAPLRARSRAEPDFEKELRRRRLSPPGAGLATALALVLSTPAFADGGAGGSGFGPAGGVGGATNPTGAGGNGGNSTSGAGGGGGAGVTGGTGGSSSSGGVGGAGGANGANITASGSNTAGVSGSAGANGGSTSNTFTGGGGGGAGGYGVVVNGSNLSYQNSGPIAGGAGGAGGASQAGVGGNGGDGGIGVDFVGGGTLSNTGSITGGAGGAGGAGEFTNGAAGAGGAGLVASSGLTITNSGAIAGGAGNGGQANAITLNGGASQLTLQTGWSLGGGIAINGTGTSLTFTDAIPVVLSNTISGTGSVTQAGPGALTLTGVNTYTGGTSVSGSGVVLGVGNNSALGAGTLSLSGSVLQAAANGLTIANALSLSLNPTIDSHGNTFTLSGNIANSSGGASGLTIADSAGGGTVVLSGSSTYTGATNVGAGTLQAGSTNAFAMSSAFTVAGGAGLALSGFNETIGSLSGAGSVTLAGGALTTGNDGTSTTFSGVISDSGAPGSLTKIGGGTLTLTGANTFTGGASLGGGTLAVGNNAALGAGALAMSANTTLQAAANNLALGNAVSLAGAETIDTQTNALVLAGPISGSGALTKIGSGTLTLSGASTYAGGTSLSAGTLAVGSNAALGTGALAMSANTTLQAAANNLALGNAISLAGAETVDTQANALTLSGPISGAGGVLTKIGSGALTLRGANTYTGGTNLNAGTLAGNGTQAFGSGTLTMANGTTVQAAATGANATPTLALGNAIVLNGNDTFDTQGGTIGVGQGISGAGSLTKIGSGTLGLFAGDTYTGGTTVSAGTLVVGNSSALGSGALSLAGGTALGFSGGASLTLANNISISGEPKIVTTPGLPQTVSGVISGGGMLEVAGGGVLALAGANTYSGGTTICGPSCGAGSGNTIVQVTNSNPGVSSSIGTGALTLDNGMLQAGAANLTIANSIALNTTGGALDSNGTRFTVSGVIANGNGTTGALTIADSDGGGTVVLTGANTYTGPTTVASGTLALGSGGSIAASSGLNLASGTNFSIANSGGNQTIQDLTGAAGSTVNLGAFGLTAGAADSTVFAGVIAGPTPMSGLTKQGTGTLVLDGVNTYLGPTTVNAGVLEIGDANNPGAKIAGGVTVNSGGTLAGHGTVGGAVTNQSGTVMPGGSIGTLSVGGNYVQGANGTLVAQLSPAAASVLAVSGTATLNGTLVVAPTAGTYIPKTLYPILTAGGGVTGTFATFVNQLPALNLTLNYLPNAVDLLVTGSNFIGQTRNEDAVAGAINQVFLTSTGDLSTALVAAASVPQSQIPQTLSVLGGQIYGNLAEVSLQDRGLFLGAMDERMRLLDEAPGAAALGGLVPGWGVGTNGTQMAALGNAISDPQTAQMGAAAPGTPLGLPANVWARGFGQFGNIANSNGVPGVDYSTGGGAIGTELIRTPGSLLGVAASGGQSSVSLNTNSETGTISFVQLGAYGAQALGYGAALDGAVIYSHDFYDVSRGIVLPGLSRTATSSYGGDDAVVDLGLSRPIAYNSWQITPRAGFTYFHIGQSDFSESGANSLDLTVNPNALDALRSKIGVSIAEPMMWGATQVLPELRAAWTHDFLDETTAFATAFAGAPTAGFNEIGAPVGRDAADVGAGLSFAISQAALPGQLTGFVQYDGTFSAHQTNNAVAAGVKLNW